MKRAIVTVLALVSMFTGYAIYAGTALILDSAGVWNNGTLFDADIDGNTIIVQGTAGRQSAGIVLEDRKPIGQAKSVVIDVNNALDAGNQFSDGRMFRLEIDRRPLKTKDLADRDSKDTTYVTARDGKFVFPLKQPTIANGYISKFQIVFYDCKVNGLSMQVSLE